MSKYIDADKLLKSTISKYRCVPLVGIHSYRNGEEYFDGEDFDDLINNTPTADVVEVRHGEWIRKDGFLVCSECDATKPIAFSTVLKTTYYKCDFCNRCGAKMDGERSKKHAKQDS